jgi:lipoprotein NlpD
MPAAPPLVAPADGGDDRVDWSWPVRGRIISGYSESASLKGIDIGGASGVPILASAPGKVVYAGSGLRGYGKLVIVKHNKTYLSAYAHLDQITVKEGQTVGKGQELGKMGNTDADQVKLHFEIRSLGKPVDPLRYLPKG